MLGQTFKQRWLVLLTKLETSINSFMLDNMDNAFYMLRSAQFDYQELLLLMATAQKPLASMPDSCAHFDETLRNPVHWIERWLWFGNLVLIGLSVGLAIFISTSPIYRNAFQRLFASARGGSHKPKHL